jgi:hypothetical protein
MMIDPDSKLGRELKAAEDCFALAKTASSPFMCRYYRRVGERYLSSRGELRSLVMQNERPYPTSKRSAAAASTGAP